VNDKPTRACVELFAGLRGGFREKCKTVGGLSSPQSEKTIHGAPLGVSSALKTRPVLHARARARARTEARQASQDNIENSP